MKIRLIQPSQLNEAGEPRKFEKMFLPTLTLPTVAALTPSGIDIGITTEFVEEIDFDEDVDLVGVTAQTCQAPRAYEIGDEFRKRGRKTIMGGIHASACPEEALQHFDSVFIGEAEDRWEQVLDDVKAGNMKRIYKSDSKPDLSRLAVPRYDLLNYNHYVIPPFARTPLISIQATRGCPHRCDFCSVRKFWGPKIRNKPVSHVLKEIETIKPSRIFFSDDNICANPKYAKELFRALKPLKIRWASQMSTTVMKDPELIELAGESGCHETLLGIESVNEKVLKSIHKSFNKVNEYGEIFTRMKNAGILVQVLVIVGWDEDTPDSLRRMIDTFLDMDINYVYMSVLTPLPGTPLFEKLDSEKRLPHKDWSFYDITHVAFEPKQMSAGDLWDILWELNEQYYSVPNILRRAWRFKKQYLRYFPRDNVIEEFFFQLHMRKSVNQRCHPFSLGKERSTKNAC